jgi:SOS-response transcriptional repressor LexA
MPVSTESPSATLLRTQPARFSILTLDVAKGGINVTKGGANVTEPINVGILLEDPAHDRLYIRLRRDWDRIAPEEEVEVLEALEDGLRSLGAELGAAGVLDHFEATLSNTLRVSDRRETVVQKSGVRAGSGADIEQNFGEQNFGDRDFERAVDRLYRQHVPATVQKYVTHLPRYTLEVAAGNFKENQEVTAEGWEEVSGGLKLTPQMFVARIAGRSMEPKIPDGSLCVFRLGVTGSRQGRLVLVEALARGGNDRYTVKRYRSEKKPAGDGGSGGTWEHDRITLEPLNPEFEAWDLDPEDDGIRILAEFVAVAD